MREACSGMGLSASEILSREDGVRRSLPGTGCAAAGSFWFSFLTGFDREINGIFLFLDFDKVKGDRRRCFQSKGKTG